MISDGVKTANIIRFFARLALDSFRKNSNLSSINCDLACTKLLYSFDEITGQTIELIWFRPLIDIISFFRRHHR